MRAGKADACEGDETCEGGDCVGAEVSVERLPEYERVGENVGMDAGDPDTGTRSDSGRDGGRGDGRPAMSDDGGCGVDTQVSTEHCGECDDPCTIAGQICGAGVCECPTKYVACDDGSGGEVCANTQTDTAHCGERGFVCPEDSECTAGRCEDTINGCTYCSTENCVDLQTDEAHCGACGRACPAGTQCVGGECECVSDEEILCSPGQPLADRTCVDKTSDAHCGVCDSPCTAEFGCLVDGTCGGCDAGETVCGETCADLTSDEANCGKCGRACPGDHTCTNGACKPNDGGASDCKAVYSAASERYFLLCPANASWNEARNACQGFGPADSWGLATLDDTTAFAEEQDLLAGEATLVNDSLSWWIGGRDQGDTCDSRFCGTCTSEGSPTYYWIEPGVADHTAGTAFCEGNGTCSPIDPFTNNTFNWNDGEPNNAGCGSGCSCNPDEDCVQMYSDGTWADARCSVDSSYICESRF